ncbi:MAG: hypothetical protein KAH32_04655 [Chlamydiia bacterium]|nr:hypothetical protein [Chlamydiia bacterium]
MIYLKEIQEVVNNSYRALGEMQYIISVREPVGGDPEVFNKNYNISTRILANLEYIDMLELNISYIENTEIEEIIRSLQILIDKVKKLCR